jgi:hypothetical protein
MTKSTIETKACKIHLPLEAFVPLEMMTMDPVTQKPRYGARSLLITKLLLRYFDEIGFTSTSEPLSDDQINSIKVWEHVDAPR